MFIFSRRPPASKDSNGLRSATLVHANYRYAGAWQEINTRIAQRQNALTAYIALSGVVTGTLFSWKAVGLGSNTAELSAKVKSLAEALEQAQKLTNTTTKMGEKIIELSSISNDLGKFARTAAQTSDPTLLFLLLPVFSIAFALLNAKHDFTIAVLRDFLRECETAGLADAEETQKNARQALLQQGRDL